MVQTDMGGREHGYLHGYYIFSAIPTAVDISKFRWELFERHQSLAVLDMEKQDTVIAKR